LINKKNKLLYSIPYQHYTNVIENYFSIFKSKIRKLEGLTYTEIKENISKVIKNISKETFESIFKGSYDRQEVYIKKAISRKKKVKNYL
jgi:hypothetical protein